MDELSLPSALSERLEQQAEAIKRLLDEAWADVARVSQRLEAMVERKREEGARRERRG